MRKRRKAAIAMILALTVSAAASGCTTFDNFKEAFFSEKGAASDTVRIGVLEPQTGNDSSKGELEIRGIELAHKLFPEVLGKEVELVYADTQSSIYVAETAVADLIDKKPAVVLGSYGDAVSLVASRQLGEAKIPAITVTATNPLITANNEYYFRVSFTDASQGSALADFTYEYLGLAKAAVIREIDEDSVTEMVSQYTNRMEELTKDTGAIAATIQVERNAKDYSACIEKLQASGAQAVFMPLPISAAEKVFQAAAKAGLDNVVFIGPKDWTGKELLRLQEEYPGIKIAVASDSLTEASDGNQAGGAGGQGDQKDQSGQDGAGGQGDQKDQSGQDSTGGQSDQKDQSGQDSTVGQSDQKDQNSQDGEAAQELTDLYQKFLAAYKEEYGTDNPPEAAALGFDAYMIALQAIEKAESIDGYLVKEAMKTTSGYVGASGEISFGATGEPKKTIHVNMIQDGAFVTVYTVN